LARAASALGQLAEGNNATDAAKVAEATERLIKEAVDKAVARSLDADVNSRLASLIESVVEACAGRGIHEHHHDDAGRSGGNKSGAPDDSLVRSLRSLAGE